MVVFSARQLDAISNLLLSSLVSKWNGHLQHCSHLTLDLAARAIYEALP